MVAWTVQKVIKCLELVIPEDRLPKFSMEEFDSFKKYGLFYETDIIKQILEIIYKKSPKTMEMNGSIEEVLKEILVIERIPMFHVFSDGIFELSEDFILGQFVDLQLYTNQIARPELDNFDAVFQKKILISKTDLLIYFYLTFDISKMSPIGAYFAKNWLLSFMNERYKELKNSYELLDERLWSPLRKITTDLMNSYFVKPLDHEMPFGIDAFINLLHEQGFDKKYPQIMKKSIEFLHEQANKNPKNINELHRKAMKELLSMIITITRVYNSNKVIFSPFPKSGPISDHQVPFIRVFHDIKLFVFSKEFENALRIGVKNRLPNKTFPEGLIQIETEEDRKLGIVYIIDIEKVENILKIVGLQISHFHIVNTRISRNLEEISFPMISPYGTYCKSFSYAFQQISHYVSSVLQVFKGVNESKFLKISRMIEANVESVFSQRTAGYCVETWKVDELINKLRVELRDYKPAKMFEIEKKSNYGKNELVSIVRAMSKPLVFKDEIIEAHYKNEKNRSKGVKYHHIFLFYNRFIYDQIISSTKIFNVTCQPSSFSESVSKKEPKNMEVKEFSTMKKGFLNIKRNETVKETNEKSNVEKEKTDRELEEKQIVENDEKFRTEINKMQGKLKELNEKNNSTEKSREDAIINWEKKFEICQSDLKRSQLENEKIGKEKDEQILTLRKEIEQLKNLSEENIRKLEEKHRNEVERCRNENKNLTRSFEKMKIDSESENKNIIAENVRLQSTISENSHNIQEFEQWFMTGYKFLEKNKRKTEVGQRLEKYRRLLEIDYDDLIDTLSSQLNRLILLNPNSTEIKFARTQVSDFDEQVDDYIKKIRKEIKKIRENPDISIDQLGAEIEQFPNENFLKIYRKLVKNDDLEKLFA